MSVVPRRSQRLRTRPNSSKRMASPNVPDGGPQRKRQRRSNRNASSTRSNVPVQSDSESNDATCSSNVPVQPGSDSSDKENEEDEHHDDMDEDESSESFSNITEDESSDEDESTDEESSESEDHEQHEVAKKKKKKKKKKEKSKTWTQLDLGELCDSAVRHQWFTSGNLNGNLAGIAEGFKDRTNKEITNRLAWFNRRYAALQVHLKDKKNKKKNGDYTKKFKKNCLVQRFSNNLVQGIS
eukprot:507302_1